MRKLAIAMAGVAMISGAVPAAAQDSGWWNVTDSQVKAALKRAAGGADKMRAFALCAVEREPELVSALLATKMDSSEEKKAMQIVMRRTDRCTPEGEFTLGGLSFRGSLAEAMYWTRYSGVDLTSYQAGPTTGDREIFGSCTVAGQADAARKLIATAPESSQEQAEIETLMPSIKECLAQTSIPAIDMKAVRLLVAQAMYQAAFDVSAKS